MVKLQFYLMILKVFSNLSNSMIPVFRKTRSEMQSISTQAQHVTETNYFSIYIPLSLHTVFSAKNAVCIIKSAINWRFGCFLTSPHQWWDLSCQTLCLCSVNTSISASHLGSLYHQQRGMAILVLCLGKLI